MQPLQTPNPALPDAKVSVWIELVDALTVPPDGLARIAIRGDAELSPWRRCGQPVGKLKSASEFSFLHVL